MTFKLEIDRSYPKNDPSNAAYVKNLVYTITEPNQQNGLSFAYQQTGRSWSTAQGVAGSGRKFDYGSRSGNVTVSGVSPAWFPEDDVAGWSKAFKSAVAYYIDLGALIASDSGGVLTSNAVRNYT